MSLVLCASVIFQVGSYAFPELDLDYNPPTYVYYVAGFTDVP
jgi:hypothetical protein